ncbi:NYN domain-containing protein [Patescibacteria group bacterium]|nr:NYN domain-containing protein [Patescibacteria group bacterium]MBU1911355.1 NYN domain-containing protein [Patescibacteria group bacterium]
MDTKPNLAFIDGQNLHLGTTQDGWKINYKRFRRYLLDKYKVEEANYFLGFTNEDEQDLYSNLQKAGFIVCFREHSSALKATKKGNVDTDIVFEVMRTLIERDDFGKIILVSGDGDYKKLVDYLIKKGRLEKILFPNRQYASSLYRNLTTKYCDYLENIKEKVQHT